MPARSVKHAGRSADKIVNRARRTCPARIVAGTI
jgi:hypothetical protein